MNTFKYVMLERLIEIICITKGHCSVIYCSKCPIKVYTTKNCGLKIDVIINQQIAIQIIQQHFSFLYPELIIYLFEENL